MEPKVKAGARIPTRTTARSMFYLSGFGFFLGCFRIFQMWVEHIAYRPVQFLFLGLYFLMALCCFLWGLHLRRGEHPRPTP